MKAAAVVKLEAALSSMVPLSFYKGIMDIMTSVTLPMYKRLEEVEQEEP